ncbi:MAG: hypothetical protein HZC47_01585 [Methanobacterium sp.]|uniref:hypothetical protein n=1 Tax=Methanobacterium sp. TaxID=2164 RepID=UPI003D65FC87|nr:hypothetical protein [Methanobacterium sp.]
MESLNLTLAESLMIISPKSNGNEMIKITLMDLLLKKALKIDILEQESRFLKRRYDAIVISNGESSHDLAFKPHEQLLMDLIFKYGELDLKEFAKKLYGTIRASDYMDMYIRVPLVNEGYFERQRKMILALIPYNTYVLTDKGDELKSKIMNLLDEAEYLEKWMREDLPHAKAYLSVIGSHILLLKNYDIGDIKRFNKKLSYIKPESNTNDYYSYYLYTVPFTYLDDFDNLQSFDFLDISLLDNFDSFDDFFSDFDAGSGDSGGDGGGDGGGGD